MDPTQLTFQEFMLGGGAGKKKKNNKPTTSNTVSTPSPARSKKSHESSLSSSSGRKKGKEANPIVVKAIHGKLEEWKDLDKDLGNVLKSIENLRFRIKCETAKIRERGQVGRNHWEGFGACNANDVLLLADIELALDHDLLQHEKMMSGARTLMSSIATVMDAIGRRLNEWMMLDYNGSFITHDEDSAATMRLLQMTQTVYLWLSDEVYRKQRLVTEVLESAAVDGEDETSLTVANQCYREWKTLDTKGLEMMENLLRISL